MTVNVFHDEELPPVRGQPVIKDPDNGRVREQGQGLAFSREVGRHEKDRSRPCATAFSAGIARGRRATILADVVSVYRARMVNPPRAPTNGGQRSPADLQDAVRLHQRVQKRSALPRFRLLSETPPNSGSEEYGWQTEKLRALRGVFCGRGVDRAHTRRSHYRRSRTVWRSPVVRGLRIRVTDVLDLLASGLSPEKVIDELPDLELDDVSACLRFASRRLDHPIVAA